MRFNNLIATSVHDSNDDQNIFIGSIDESNDQRNLRKESS
jgi:hypothetical protein